ncbi:MAG: hypothetical protein HQL03_03515 [Nitrospirae bacterium]|nr:hypothetical protein [Nitrospirota bacterium]
MKSKFLVLLLLFAVVFAGFSLAQAATSQLDNMPGGAGFAYWQTNSNWKTLINVQNVDWNGTMATAVLGCTGFWVDIILFDENSRHIADWQMPLTPADNTGFTISGTVTSGSATGSINILPYSVGGSVCGVSGTIGIPTAGLTISGINVNPDGYMKGYVSIVIRPPAAMANSVFETPDIMMIRAAYTNGNVEAFALNAPMFQGFINFPGVITESNRDLWIDTVPRPNQRTICDANMNGSIADSYGPQKATRETIGFWEMMLTNNVFIPYGTPATAAAPWGRIVCDLGQRTYPVLGSSNGIYWGRYNVGGGYASSLMMVAPASSAGLDVTPAVGQQIASPRFARHLDANSYDDAENPISTILDFPEVARIAFGTANGNILVNSVAGDTRFKISVPIFGFTYTESTGGLADVYPLVLESRTVSVTNLAYSASTGIYYSTALNASALPLAQTVTDYGNFYDIPGTYWGPWVSTRFVGAASVGTYPYVSPASLSGTGVTQTLGMAGAVLGATGGTVTFAETPAENLSAAITAWDNATPISPEVGSLSNHSESAITGDFGGYRLPSAPLCSFALDTAGMCNPSNMVFDCTTQAATLGKFVCPNAATLTYYNACYGVCYKR